MPSLVPDAVNLALLDRSLDLTTGTFYAHLVTAEPTGASSTVANCTLATGGNYATVVLAGRSMVADGTGAKLTFDNPAWPALTTDGTQIVGMIICRQAGGAPAGTDPVVGYNRLSTPFTPPTANGTDFTVKIPSNGVLKAD
jgi:hypothetical protein